MEVLRLILNIISSAAMFLFGAVMIWAGIYNIKKHIESKWFSTIAIITGTGAIVLVVTTWFW